MRLRLERYFEFERLGANWRTEILAGMTTFVTMAYIIFVNPSILHEAGMPLKAVVAATCFCAAFGSIAMGAFARYPIALAPGMGEADADRCAAARVDVQDVVGGDLRAGPGRIHRLVHAVDHELADPVLDIR